MKTTASALTAVALAFIAQPGSQAAEAKKKPIEVTTPPVAAPGTKLPPGAGKPKADPAPAPEEEKPATPPKGAPGKPAAAPVAEEIVLPEVVAVVDGAEIKKAELLTAVDRTLKRMGGSIEQMPGEQKRAAFTEILNQLIVDTLVDKQSAKIEVTDAQVDEVFTKFKAQIEAAKLDPKDIKVEIRGNIRKRNWVESQITDKVAVSDADAEKFYNENKDKFKMPEQVKASHILIRLEKEAKAEDVTAKEKTAMEILARVKKGEDFAKLAGELSEDPSAKQNNGDLGFFGREQMVPEFSDAAFGLKKDEVSGLVRSQFGFHIIKATDRKAAGDVPLAEAKADLKNYLGNQKREAAVGELFGQLREKANVKVLLK